VFANQNGSAEEGHHAWYRIRARLSPKTSANRSSSRLDGGQLGQPELVSSSPRTTLGAALLAAVNNVRKQMIPNLSIKVLLS
jgi:hypothetical protein